MSFLSSIFRSRDKPTDSTSGSAYRFFLGGTTSGKTVTERSAMQMTAVYSCVRILSEAIAGLPLHLYKYNEKGGKHHKPHIHAEYQGMEIVIALDGDILEEKEKFPRNKLKLIEAWMEIHREDLEANWQLLSEGQKFFKIPPLQ